MNLRRSKGQRKRNQLENVERVRRKKHPVRWGVMARNSSDRRKRKKGNLRKAQLRAINRGERAGVLTMNRVQVGTNRQTRLCLQKKKKSGS